MSSTNENPSVAKNVINWYPGHMARTKREIKELISLVDIVFELLDARMPLVSKLKDLKEFILDKPKVIVLTKYDLCDKEKTNKYIEELSKEAIVLTTYLNDNNIKDEIVKVSKTLLKNKFERSKRKNLLTTEIRGLVVGIPNVGKSTLINNLAGKKIQKVENKPGVTKKLNWIKITNDFYLLDSPGILEKKITSYDEGMKLAAMSSINESIIDYQEMALFLYNFFKENYSNRFLTLYKLDKFTNFSDDIQAIGRKRGALIKGGEVDLEKTYLVIFQDFKNNKFSNITF